MSQPVKTVAESFDDPYAERPAWWRQHPEAAASVAAGLLTVILTVLSFPPATTPEFAYAALVPGIFWAYLRPRFRIFALTMLGAQAVSWTILLGWLHHVTWAGLFLLGPFTGVWIGLWYLAAWWGVPRLVGRPTLIRLAGMLGLAAAWVLIEWTRTWFLTGFPWLPLAASQWERPAILQVASYTGAWGVSFVLVAANIGFAAYAHRLFREGRRGLSRRSQEFFLVLFLLLVCLSIQVQDTYNRGAFTEPLVRVAIVQPAIPQSEKWDETQAPEILRVLESNTMAAAFTNPDLIVWPEAVTPWALERGTGIADWVEQLGRRAGSTVILGSIAEEDADGTIVPRNGVFVIDPEKGLQSHPYFKRKLVPFGEYVPLRPVLGWLRKVVPIGEDFQPAAGANPLVVTAGAKALIVGNLICFEDTYPGLARDSVREGAEILLVLTNNAWFGEGGAAPQHAAHSVLRAVETRRPVLRVGNAGWSGWIDEFGGIRYRAVDQNGSIYFRGTRTVNVSHDVRWVGQETFYTRHGNWFVAACALMAGLAAMLLSRPPPPPEPVPDQPA